MPAPDPTPHPQPAWGNRVRRAAPCAILVALAIWMLGNAVLRWPAGSLPGADLALVHPAISAAAGGARPTNPMLFDVGAIVVPWALLCRDALRSGELPLWNPWNGFGAPLLGNIQSSVFSLFQLPFYFTPIQTALLLSAGLKLLLGPWFLLGFLRLRGFSAPAALVAAAGFMLGGFHLAWLFWAHSGVVGCGLMLLYFLERALMELGRGGGIPGRLRLGIWLAAALGSTAGHPHLWILILIPALAWAAVRVGVLRPAPGVALRGLAAPVALGLLSASIVWVPFFEFLRRADLEAIHGVRTAGVSPLSPVSLLLNYSPLALGNPAHGAVAFNTQEMLGLHAGPLTLLLATAGLALGWRRLEVRLFGGLALLVSLYAFNVAGVAGWLGAIPPLSVLPATRLPPVILLGLAVLAAVGLDHIRTLDGRRRIAVWLLGLGLLGAFAPTAWSLLVEAQPAGEAAARTAGSDLMVRTGLAVIGWTAVLGGAGAGSAAVRRASIGIALLVVAHTLGQPFRAQWPIIPSSHNLPPTPALASARLGTAGAMAADASQRLLPSINAVYDVATPAAYDGLYVAETSRLVDLVGGTRFGWQAKAATDPFFLALFGIDHVIAPDPAQPLRRLRGQPGRFYIAPSVRTVGSGSEALQRIRARQVDPLRAPLVVDPEGTLAPLTAGPAQTAPIRVETAEVGRRSTLLVARTERPGFLVAVMTWYPGWRAEVDGRPANLYRTNYGFMGLPLEPGLHRVRLIYDPASVRVGFWLTLVGLAGGAVAAFTPGQRASRSSG